MALREVRVYTTPPPTKYALAAGTDRKATEIDPQVLDSATAMDF